MLGVLGPALGRTVLVDTAPPTLHPDKTGRTTEAGQIPDVDAPSFFGNSPNPTGRTSHDVIGRLDRDQHLGRSLGHFQNPKADKSQQRLGRASSVTHVRGSSSLKSLNNSNDVGTPGRVAGPSRSSYSLLKRVGPVWS